MINDKQNTYHRQQPVVWSLFFYVITLYHFSFTISHLGAAAKIYHLSFLIYHLGEAVTLVG
jgi:hypothetical protein